MAAVVMSQEALSVAVQNLQTGLASMEATLNGILSKVPTDIAVCAATASDNLERIKKEFAPLVQGKLTSDADIENLKRASLKHDGMCAGMEATLQTLGANTRILDKNLVEADRLYKELKQDVLDYKQSSELKDSSVQGQLTQISAAQMTAKPHGGGGGGGGGSGHLATCKLMTNVSVISGGENFNELDDWYTTITINTEMEIPGAKRILDWAQCTKTQITPEVILERQDKVICDKLGREIYLFLHQKTSGSAKAYVRTLEAHEGLEGWRLIRQNLVKRDAHRLQAEWDNLIEFRNIKMSDMCDLSTYIATWEAELKKYMIYNSDFVLPKSQRRTIINKSLPAEIQSMVEVEKAKLQLETFDLYISFITNLASSHRFQKKADLKGFGINVFNDAVPEAKPTDERYTDDQYVLWVQTQ